MGVDTEELAIALSAWEHAQRTTDEARTKAWEANAAKRFLEACGLGGAARAAPPPRTGRPGGF